MADPTEGLANLTVSDDFSQKHHLQYQWCWWYDSPGKKTTSANWTGYVKKVYTFATVEDFWCLYNNIKPAHAISQGSNYHLFKEGIAPTWEDATNAPGGRWVVQLPNKSREDQLEKLWLYLILACIGENFTDSDQITGAVVSIRKGADRISLWTKDARDEAACLRIGEQFKQFLGLKAEQQIGFQRHSDVIAGKSANLFTV